MSLTLSPGELRELTGRAQAAAQRRALERMRIVHLVDADGRPVVLRALIEQLGGVRPGTGGATMAPRRPQVRP